MVEKPDLYVVARLLELLYKKGSPMKKTNIQLHVGLNYPRFIEYLGWLEEHGLVLRVVDRENVERISLSTKGTDAYHRLVQWIRGTMEGLKL